jgi:hypothetical protein
VQKSLCRTSKGGTDTEGAVDRLSAPTMHNYPVALILIPLGCFLQRSQPLDEPLGLQRRHKVTAFCPLALEAIPSPFPAPKSTHCRLSAANEYVGLTTTAFPNLQRRPAVTRTVAMFTTFRRVPSGHRHAFAYTVQ